MTLLIFDGKIYNFILLIQINNSPIGRCFYQRDADLARMKTVYENFASRG